MDISEIDSWEDQTAQQLETETEEHAQEQEHQEEPPVNTEGNQEEDTIIDTLLKSKGIQDSSRIKFEDEDGSIKETPWSDLTKEEQLNILQSSNSDPNYDLSDDEIAIINDLRSSRLTPEKYIESIKQLGAKEYSAQDIEEPTYTVDQYDDDSLFIYDQQSRYGLSQEEAQQSLETAKSNPELYAKQIQGIRSDYKEAEDMQTQQSMQIAQQEQEQQFQDFQNNVINEIGQLDSIGSMDMDMTNEDKNNLAAFILDKDQAGVSYLARALDDPKTLVKMAWFALNGDDAFSSLDDYVGQQIKEVSRAQYDKGYRDAKANKAPQRNHVVNRPNNSRSQQTTRKVININDLD